MAKLIIRMASLVVLCLAFLSSDVFAVAPQMHHSAIFLSFINKLKDRDSAFTLALDKAVAFRLETLPNISLIPDTEIDMFLSESGREKLWQLDKVPASEINKKLGADIIIIARHSEQSGGTVLSEFRLFYLPLDDTIRTMKFDVRHGGADLTALQKILVIDLLSKFPIVPGAASKLISPPFSDKKAFRQFGDGLRMIEAGAIDAGLATLEKTAADYPAYRDLHYYLGIFYSTRRFNFDRAVKHLKLVTTKYTGDAGAIYWLGYAQRIKGDTESAAAEFEKAKKIKADFLEVYINLGMIYSEAGVLDKAAENYKTATRITPFLPSVWYSLACILALNKDPSGSVAALRRALEIDPATYYKLAVADSDLASLHRVKEYRDLMLRFKQ